MAEETIRLAALGAIKRLLKEDRLNEAELIASLFKASKKSSRDDVLFYGHLLLRIGKLEEARKRFKYCLNLEFDEQILVDLETIHWLLQTREPLRKIRAGVALSYLLDQEGINSVLDVGAGGGEQSLVFAEQGKSVHAVDFGRSVYVRKSKVLQRLEDMPAVKWSQMDFFDISTDKTYDLVWCSHVLEHQPDANAFLRKALSLTTVGGWLAISVPPLKHAIVGGHVSLWNAGLLLYQIIMAGNDCSDAVVMNCGYNISVLVRRRPVQLPELDYDSGDINRLSEFFPPGCTEGFDGRMIGFHARRAPSTAPAPNPEQKASTGL